MKPYECKSLDDVCKLRTDSKDVGDFWILTDGYEVSIHEQKVGEDSTQRISVPRGQFNRLIDWYLKDQKPPQPASPSDIGR